MKSRDPNSLSLLFPWYTLTLNGKVWEGKVGNLITEDSSGCWEVHRGLMGCPLTSGTYQDLGAVLLAWVGKPVAPGFC